MLDNEIMNVFELLFNKNTWTRHLVSADSGGGGSSIQDFSWCGIRSLLLRINGRI
jgi:hypothetical protein